MKEKEIYVHLEIEVLEIKMEKGYAVSGSNFNPGGGW